MKNENFKTILTKVLVLVAVVLASVAGWFLWDYLADVDNKSAIIIVDALAGKDSDLYDYEELVGYKFFKDFPNELCDDVIQNVYLDQDGVYEGIFVAKIKDGTNSDTRKEINTWLREWKNDKLVAFYSGYEVDEELRESLSQYENNSGIIRTDETLVIVYGVNGVQKLERFTNVVSKLFD